MKKSLPLFFGFLFLVSVTLQAQAVIFHDYGEGLAFPINESGIFDIDEDGAGDLWINSVNGKLGFTTVPNKGCVHVYDYWDTDIDGFRIRVLDEGDPIQFTGLTGMVFAENEDLWLYGGEGNTYVDWEDGEEKYIGLLSVVNSSPAWMKIRVDTETQTLYIISYAYTLEFQGLILTGQTETTILDVPEIESINDVTVFPNPATNLLSIDLELIAASSVEIQLKSMNGQQVRSEVRELSTGFYRENMDVSNLANGIYQLTIQSNGEFITRSVTIAR